MENLDNFLILSKAFESYFYAIKFTSFIDTINLPLFWKIINVNVETTHICEEHNIINP